MNIGRNDPCPCGSGKKYKNCCLDKDIKPSVNIYDSESGIDQYSGYTTESSIKSIEVFFSEEESACLATLIRNEKDSRDLLLKHKIGASIGEWVVSTGGCDDIKIYGPFKSMDEAFKYGEKEFGVKRWLSGMSGNIDGIDLDDDSI